MGVFERARPAAQQVDYGIHSVFAIERAEEEADLGDTTTATSAKRSKPGAAKRSVLVKDKNFIGLTEKVFAVLETFSQDFARTYQLEEITGSVGMAKTTVYRLALLAEKIGYVDQHEMDDLLLE